MKKFIEVYDNIIPAEFSNYLENLVLKNGRFPLYYVHNITDRLSNEYHPGMSHDLGVSRTFNPLFNNILYKLGDYNNFFITEVITSRLFLHLPSPNPGLDPIHIDMKDPHWVCLYYINDSDGDTVLFEDDEKTEIKRVTPKKGRIIFFDGSIKHCSSRPSKYSRAIVNFNFLAERF